MDTGGGTRGSEEHLWDGKGNDRSRVPVLLSSSLLDTLSTG